MDTTRSLAAIYFELGKALYGRGRHEEAVRVIKQALQEEDGNLPKSEVYLTLSQTYQALGKKREALDALSKAVAADPNLFSRVQPSINSLSESLAKEPVPLLSQLLRKLSPSAPARLKEMAEKLMANGDYAGAEKVLRSLSAAWPDDAEAFERLGFSLIKENKLLDGVVALERSTRLNSKRVQPLGLLGKAYLKLNENDKALEALNRALALEAGDTKALLRRGIALARLNRLDEGEADLRRVLKHSPSDVKALQALADVQRARGDPRPAADTMTEAARASLQNRDFAAAITFSKGARELDPSNQNPILLQAQALRQTGELGAAASLLQEATARLETQELLLEYASICLELKDFEHALNTIDATLRHQPKNPVALLLKGRSLSAMARNAEALEFYEESLRLNPDRADAQCEYGILLHSANRPDEALQAIERSLSIDPNWAPALKAMALLRTERAELQEAVPFYEKALQQAAGDTDLLRGYGLVLFGLKRYRDALGPLEKALAHNPTDLACLRAYGTSLRLENRHEEAVSTFEKVLDLEGPPGSASILRQLGESLRLLNRFREAQSIFRRSLALEKEPFAYSRYGETLRMLGELEEAEKNLKLALDLKPDDAWTVGVLGATLAGQQSYRSALEKLNRSIELNSNDSWTLSFKGFVLRVNSRFDEALQAYDKALNISPDDSWILTEKSTALLEWNRPGDNEKAQAVIERALANDSKYIWAKVQLAICLFKMGNLKDSLTCVRDAESDPSVDWLPQFKALLLWRLNGSPLDAPGKEAQFYLERSRVFLYVYALNEAEADLRKAIELDEGDPASRNELAWLLAEKCGQLESALPIAREAVEILRYPPNLAGRVKSERVAGSIYDTLGYIHLKRKELEDAGRWLRAALKYNNESLAIEDHLKEHEAIAGAPGAARAVSSEA